MELDMELASLIGALIAAAVAIISLVWNGIQQGRIKKLETEGAKAVHVHRIQFEKEFDIYSELWKELLKLKSETDILLILDREFHQEDFNKYWDLHAGYYRLFQMYKPFLPESIFNQVNSFLSVTKKEYTNQWKRSGNGKESNSLEEVKQNQDKVLKSIDLICDSIRARIHINEAID